MNIVIAPDKFKGSLTATQAAEAIAQGVTDVLPSADVVLCPVADGGEGTIDVLLAAGARRVDVAVYGPLTRRVGASYAVLGDIAYIESAQACGIEYVDPDPTTALNAHTFGVGELITHAIKAGARRLLLTVGGTASTDGGAGMLSALGARILTRCGKRADLGGAALTEVETVNLAGVAERIGSTVIGVATDVTNPLLGSRGAAVVFGPQKGAGQREIDLLESALAQWSNALAEAGQSPMIGTTQGSGAGGGLAAGAIAGLGASFESGFDLIATATGLERAIRGADIVITGEGRLDTQSLSGKAPSGVSRLGVRYKTPVVAIAGQVRLKRTDLVAAGITKWKSLLDKAPSLGYAKHNAALLLREQARELIREWLKSAHTGVGEPHTG